MIYVNKEIVIILIIVLIFKKSINLKKINYAKNLSKLKKSGLKKNFKIK